ncbi:hypothetical protein [Aestuariispira insulae]|uniref:Uncharacterized protein n=1 Tax=Aestuariispira insulae TaxID=1461337 RepID=A0A3D9HQ90_9PROT|nr:hypothetical protein [Aestuariispira insulae]RED51471.1 hypothetical protein DFP90_103273 [Aestuariispira insulae]
MDDKTAQVLAFIESLPEKELRKLAATVELDRNSNKLGLPHNAIMALLRPSLALIRAPRALIPQRAFCLPFEDMLVSGKPSPRPDGQIDRSSIIPMWKWMTGDLAGPQIEDACARYIEAEHAGDDAGIKDLSHTLWTIGAKALTDGLNTIGNDEKANAALAKKLGGDDILTDVRLMAACLRIAEPLEKLKAKLPPNPMVGFSKDQLFMASEAYAAAEAINPPDAMVLLLALAGRLLRPFPIMNVIKTVTRGADDIKIQRTDLAVPGNIVFSALEADAQAVIEAAQIPSLTDEDIIPKVRYFAEGFRTIVEAIPIKRNGEWGKRMHNCRQRVSEELERRLLRDARKVVMKALPTRSGGTVPKLAAEPDDRAFELAEDRAQAIGTMLPFADKIGLKGDCSAKVSEIRKELEKYADGLLKALPNAPADKRAIAFAFLCIAVRLVEVMENPDEADMLRKRGMLALDAASR